MYNLILDTSTKYLYLALVKDDKVIKEIQTEGLKNHAGMSVFELDKMLNEAGITVDDLEGIYCGYGPGSYTGERISVTIAKMLASLKNIPLYAVSSLYLAASGYDEKSIAVMFDARRGNVFSCLISATKELPDKLRDKEAFLKEIGDSFIVTEDNFKVNPIKVMQHASLVTEPDGFVPNYLRISEAEYNLEHRND